ncbi:MAG: class II aldolase/adducin family protein [Jatrophihabitans sp.]|uniref:class II aldolase/adducin family protein n=1 Tax=Jatrophihabitans sp. TaxID=1932789 RepID=UPI003F800551
MRDELLRVGRALVDGGLVVGAGGNLTARVASDRLLVTPTGWNLAELGPDDLAEVDLDGRHLSGPHAATSELPLHLAVLRARPDITWAVHAHPPMATLLGAVGVPIRLITTDHVHFVRRIAHVPFLHPGSRELAEAAAGAAASADVIMLRHHGCLVLADDPRTAVSRALNLEAAAVATFHARQLGDDTTICPPEFAVHLATEEARGRRYGTRRAAE